MIISVLNQKGGVGKTTLSIHIASTLALADKKVLLVDADSQGSALDWAAVREEPPLFNVVGISKNTIHREMPTLSEAYDFVVIDGPPRISDVAKSAIAASDFILIPVQPSPYDIWAASDVVGLIKEVKSTLSGVKKIQPCFVINRKINRTVLGREVEDALKGYEDIPVLKTTIGQRVTYTESASRGTSAVEEDPDSVAGQEIQRMVKEIIYFGQEK